MSASDTALGPARPPRTAPGHGRVVRVGAWSLVYRRRPLLVGVVLVVTLVVLGVLGLTTGDYPISVAGVVHVLVGNGVGTDRFIVMDLRLPRVLVAAMVGAAFAMSGAMFQSLTRNPLGSPDIIGFTLGSTTGALVELLIVGGGMIAVSTASIIGGFATAAVISVLALRDGVNGYRLVLVGIGVGALLLACNSYLILRANLTDAMAAAAWLVGSLDGRSWAQAGPLAVALVVLVPLALATGRSLTVSESGDDVAAQLGVRPARFQLAVVAIAVALGAFAVAAAGPIAFVALAAPQLAKRLTRRPGPGLVASALMGAVLLIASDLVAQRLFAPTRLPVGVVTGVLGGAYLAGLLASEWRTRRT